MNNITIFDYLAKASNIGLEAMMTFNGETIIVIIDDNVYTANSLEEMIQDHILGDVFATLEEAYNAI